MRYTLLFLFGLLCSVSVLAQDTFTLTGRVEDVRHEPLIGALVQVVGTTRGATTDIDGSFSLERVAVGDSLLCSFVGYESRRILVTGNQALNIQLVPTAELLEEFVFTGFSYQKKSEVTGAISSVEIEEVPEVPAMSLERVLQGQASGILVSGGNGVPGGNAQVLIRGFTSIDAGTDPLYIVDGVQINQEPSNQFGG